MRFGKDFKAIQDPLWSSTYIRYEQLKTLLKLTCGGAGISNGSTNANGEALMKSNLMELSDAM